MINKIASILGSSESNDNSQQNRQDESDGVNTLDVPDRNKDYRDMIAPTTFIEESDYVRSGEDYVKVLFIMNWPDDADAMFMHNLLYSLPIDSDISIHVSPRDKKDAVEELERELEKATAQAKQGVTAASQQARQKRLQNTERVYNALKETDANLHEISMYIAVRADNEDDLRLSVEKIVREFRTNSMLPEVLSRDQREGMRSVSPIGKDEVKYKSPAVSGAVGAMYPFGTTTVIEPGGIDIGVHSINSSPVIIDRFNRENGYNQITAGKIGSGKTFGTLLEILRSKAAYGDDLIVYMLDPLNGFKPIVDMIGGYEVLVGGRVNINPMKIVETPQKILENTPDLDPFTEKKQNLIDFFDMLFQMQDRELGESRDILSMAIEQTYMRYGITKNPDTHSKKSPTIRDLIGVLRDMEEDPTEFIEVSSEDSKLVDRMEDESSRLIFALNEFEEGGQYENLGKESSLPLDDEDVVYFNLQQQEGSGSLGLMMHILLTEVYERSKETDKKVLFCIDEAHYIMSDARSLDFLEQAVRHSRHYDMGINFITQTLEEFFQHNQSEAIAQQCSMRRIHKIESGLTENIMDTLSLNASHVNYIQNAEPGSEDAGYSEALYGTDEHGYVPVKIYPSEFELSSINQVEDN